jgi:ElaB/YqjD/DUF883 family membrane-anchored ribosome-binding protein
MEPAVDFVTQTAEARGARPASPHDAQELMRTRDDMRAAFAALVAHGEAWVSHVAGLSPEAQERLRGARRRVADLGARARAGAHDTAAAADRYVRAQPWIAVGLAAGLGLAVGALLFRRS